MKKKIRKPQGFATLPQWLRQQIASLGGRAVPSEKRQFSVDRDLASRAGRKGGQSRWRRQSDE